MTESDRTRCLALLGPLTGHPSLESACEQVDYEYEDSVGEWVHVPPDVEGAHAWGVQYAAERLDGKDDR